MSPNAYILLGLFLFTIGMIGVLFRRNLMFILMNLELMMNAVGLVLVGASLGGWIEGQLIILMILVVAASEVAIGIGILINVVRLTGRPDVDHLPKAPEESTP